MTFYFGKVVNIVVPKTGIVRNHFLHIRVSDFEFEDLQEIAKETNQTLSDFVRIAVIEKKERVRKYSESKNTKDNN